MPVSDQHKLYSKNLPLWQLVGDCVEGSATIKWRKEKYLPKPNPSDVTNENKARYSAYVQRANYVNFTGFTKAGLLGMVFRKDTVTDLPTEIEYVKENANGAGLSLDQIVRNCIGETLEDGRYGFLTDYPPAPPGLTQAQQNALNLQANILPYEAEDIINWRTVMIGGVKKLSLVVLREINQVVGDDGFSAEDKTFYRVLILVDGVYVQQLYNDKNELIIFGEGEDARDFIMPLKADGTVWNEIPFTFAGAQNNDETPDKAPLLDIAEVNISHYRNSADYEESAFMVGQPTPWAAGLSQSWVDEVMKGGVLIGSRAFLLLPEGGTAGLMQADPNQMPLKGMQEKEAQMIKLGARIISDSTGDETAEAARIRFAGQTSQLAVLVGNVQAAVMKCLGWAQEFMGGTGEIVLVINMEFFESKADPNMLIAQIQLLDRGVFAKKDIRTNLRKAGMVDSDRTDDMLDNEAEDINPIV